MFHSAVVALLAISTNAQGVAEAPETPAFLRKLGGGGSSSSSSSSSSPKEPTFFVYRAPATPADCTAAIDATIDVYVEDGNSDKETNWNDATFGHAQYACVEPMIRGELQYEKAISYAWCVYPHCEERCPGAACPVHDTVAKCQSAVKNWLGYAERKKADGNLSESQKYYDEAIAAWPENCGALGYRAELELQKGDAASAKSRLSALCAHSACAGHDAVREAATTFWNGNGGRSNMPSQCHWALELDGAVAAHSAAFAWIVAIVGAMLSAAG